MQCTGRDVFVLAELVGRIGRQELVVGGVGIIGRHLFLRRRRRRQFGHRRPRRLFQLHRRRPLGHWRSVERLWLLLLLLLLVVLERPGIELGGNGPRRWRHRLLLELRHGAGGGDGRFGHDRSEPSAK